ncbi:hypothetical protein GCM10011609_57760 [Lentzea pudingi]|uniref:DUF1152 domain-containing protein n=1 Tax=Lentzea pudingi TaxID=1789439 RepID=A0ABQ2IJK4_9PSEU|nr:DUF1152 domain-containing protein [Lentzea pudingi]GGN10448.1 hypothetical protein GCM10011609_57760 [Lentzea pudingi]
MFSLAKPPLFTRLHKARNVLIAGAGGGFDVFAGIPLGVALRNEGKLVHYASLSFSDLERLDLDAWIEPGLAAVEPETSGEDAYFPERELARFLGDTVYAFPRTGVRPLRSAYRTIIEKHSIDAVVLVDGGTDILLRGDEQHLGTPTEDMTSLAAVAGVDGVVKIVTSLGFGIDAHHGVCHAHVLENLAALDKQGAYLGALSIPSDSFEARAYTTAVQQAQDATPLSPSIVNGQIAASLRGEFGNVRFTTRTEGSELFVNPLMGVYFSVDLDALARGVHYLPALEKTRTAFDVALAIEEYRESTDERRPKRALPH